MILTLLDCKVAEGEGHGVSRENVVTTEDMLAIDREATTRYYGENSFKNDKNCCVIALGFTWVRRISLWEDGDEHGDGSIVVKDTKDYPDSSQNDTSVIVKQHHDTRHQGGHDEKDLTHVQPREPVLYNVQHHIRKRVCIRHLVSKL